MLNKSSNKTRKHNVRRISGSTLARSSLRYALRPQKLWQSRPSGRVVIVYISLQHLGEQVWIWNPVEAILNVIYAFVPA